MDWLGSFGLFQGEVKLFESACLPQTQHVQELPARDLKSQHQRGECAGLEQGALGKFSRLTSQNSLCNRCLSLGRASVATVWFATCVAFFGEATASGSS